MQQVLQKRVGSAQRRAARAEEAVPRWREVKATWQDVFMSNASDAELIARSLEIDGRGAFGELVRRYQSPIRALLRKLTRGDLGFADDLAQDTFVRAYLRLESFRGDARFSTWLYRIAYNLFLGHHRRLKRRAEQNQGRAEIPSKGDTQTSSLLRMDLESAMAQLSEPERASIALCYAHGLSHPEAADVLGCPVGTVKTHILRGKEKLRKRLAAWERTVRDGTLSRR